jgi:hypothetical protein
MTAASFGDKIGGHRSHASELIVSGCRVNELVRH